MVRIVLRQHFRHNLPTVHVPIPIYLQNPTFSFNVVRTGPKTEFKFMCLIFSLKKNYFPYQIFFNLSLSVSLFFFNSAPY